jgi:glycosyltransferase involved in cell wall biosynthesis
MRVLNVNTVLDPESGGGTAERTFQISRFLIKAGIECDVLTLDIGFAPERVKALGGARIIRLPHLNRRYYIPRFSFKQIRDAVASADVIHFMGHWTLINALVYFFAKRLGKPYVVCPAGALPIYGRSKLLKSFYNLFVGEKIIRNADGHVAITVDEIPQFKAYGVPEDKVVVIPNGIAAEDYYVSDGAAFRKKFGLGDYPFILFVGRLNHIKGPDLLLEAFCQAGEVLADSHLVFVGPDEGMLPSLQRLTMQSGMGDRVHFVGYLGGTDKLRAYRAAELLVVPSRQEAMSLVALEAGIMGTPVLLTDQCGFDDVARVNGGKVAPASAEGLRENLGELLGDPPQLKLMGENLKKFVEEHLTWESAIDKYLALYNRILTEQRERLQCCRARR